MLKFKHLTSEVMDRAFELTEVTVIPNHSQIFRTNVTDEHCCYLVIEKAKFLKDTEEYRHIYISRDLTYTQRTALFSRRKARKMNPVLYRLISGNMTRMQRGAPHKVQMVTQSLLPAPRCR